MSQFNLSCGCYESILIGLDFDVKKIDKAVRANDAKTAEQLMKMAFALPSHLGSIRVVASNSKYLVTGATDEQLKIYDVRRRREIGALHHHSDAISAVEFFGVHCICASFDGTITVWRTKKWELHAILGKKKNAPVLDISVHPTGRVLLSVSKDLRLRMWNLVDGKLIYKQKFDSEIQKVEWSEDGNYYSLISNKVLQVRDKENNILMKWELSADLLVAKFFSTNAIDTKKLKKVKKQDDNDEYNADKTNAKNLFIVCGGESKHIYVYHCATGALVYKLSGHTRRIKDLGFVPRGDDRTPHLISASSDGNIKLWNLATKFQLPDAVAAETNNVESKQQYDDESEDGDVNRCIVTKKLDVRLNCLSISRIVAVPSAKGKTAVSEDSSEEDDEESDQAIVSEDDGRVIYEGENDIEDEDDDDEEDAESDENNNDNDDSDEESLMDDDELAALAAYAAAGGDMSKYEGIEYEAGDPHVVDKNAILTESTEKKDKPKKNKKSKTEEVQEEKEADDDDDDNDVEDKIKSSKKDKSSNKRKKSPAKKEKSPSKKAKKEKKKEKK